MMTEFQLRHRKRKSIHKKSKGLDQKDYLVGLSQVKEYETMLRSNLTKNLAESHYRLLFL
jgi:hypothetical protein